MKQNVAGYERLLSLTAGGALAAMGLSRRGASGWGLAGLGALLASRGLSGYCSLYDLLGVDTNRRQRRAAKSEPVRTVGVHASTLIERPRAEVFAAWRRFEHHPRFVEHLGRVDVLDDQLSHWAAELDGRSLEWDLEIVEERPDEVLRWRTVGEADLPHSGSVTFQDAPGGGTEVHLSLHYGQQLEAARPTIAKLMGLDPGVAAQSVVLRFRRFVEQRRAGSFEHAAL